MKFFNNKAIFSFAFGIIALYYLGESFSNFTLNLVSPVWFLFGLTIFLSFSAFNNNELSQNAIFDKRRVNEDGEYYRLLTHGFLHVDFFHLLVNGFAYYNFAPFLYRALESNTEHAGSLFLTIYLISIIGASFPDLKFKKGDYYAVGASGAISALLAMVVVLYPKISMGIIFLPIFLPGPVFLLIFMLISYQLSKGNSRIGHLTHLSGAVIGIVIGLFLKFTIF
jgi:membrane associated rhomboid family serine protease